MDEFAILNKAITLSLVLAPHYWSEWKQTMIDERVTAHIFSGLEMSLVTNFL